MIKAKLINVEIIRKAIANYMGSEGCSCCRSNNHEDNKKVIAELLEVPMFDDESGYDFYKFMDKKNG